MPRCDGCLCGDGLEGKCEIRFANTPPHLKVAVTDRLSGHYVTDVLRLPLKTDQDTYPMPLPKTTAALA